MLGDQLREHAGPSRCSHTHAGDCSSIGDIKPPKEVEEAIDALLRGLQDSDTVVRWSAAKGLGRVVHASTNVRMRLPPEGSPMLEHHVTGELPLMLHV